MLTYNTLIEGMCERGELQEAGRLWDEMVEKGCVPNVFTYNMLIKGFCKMGKACEGVGILKDMVDKGCLPNKFTYSILIEGLLKSKQEKDIMKVLAVATSGGLLSLDGDSWGVFVTKTVANSESWKRVLDNALLETAT
ncbi:Pentatricopeptide repeat-containing protein [Thalictrum thalictroides]|uniref:Pentatricopeptide repeat-containing protein n=1 Tax=Thalictrum thalictroides TaxID=46969 RepID=A0A7J6VPP2_THATH|nr:Pentatricopeptide repeat-containing protein [Thalictrum thalictroides]